MPILNVTITRAINPDSLALLRAAAPDAEFVCTESADFAKFPAGLLARTDVLYSNGRVPEPQDAPRLRWVQGHWAGVDHVIDAPLFAEGNVLLSTAAGVHAINMAEHALMMMLALAHRMPEFFDMMANKRWQREARPYMPMELRDASLGLIGYGAIGREIARMAQALGMRVSALRRSPSAETHDGVSFYTRERLHELLGQSDFVVVVTPLTPDTRHMLDTRALAAMKPGSYLVNIGRGAVIDEAALIEALRAGPVAGAALDVFEVEPLPAESALWTLRNVILSPHVSGITPRYEQRVMAIFADNLRRFLRGLPLTNQVDFTRGY
jgi:phosphoglycerate dehydrogenase-like enzyme